MGYGQHAQYPYRYNENVEHSLNPSQEYPSQSQPAHFMENPFDARQSERIVTPQRPQRSSHQQTSENMQAVMTHVEHKPPVPPVQQQQHSSQQNNTNLQKFEESYVPTPLKDTMNPYKTNPNRFYDQMTAPYRKAPSAPAGYSSIPATPTKLSLPVGGFDEARAFNEKQRNREYNDFVSKVLLIKCIPVLQPSALILNSLSGVHFSSLKTESDRKLSFGIYHVRTLNVSRLQHVTIFSWLFNSDT